MKSGAVYAQCDSLAIVRYSDEQKCAWLPCLCGEEEDLERSAGG